MKCYFCGREVFFMIFFQSNLVIDGGYNEWTDWSEWSECTATCGGEVVIIQEPAPTCHRKIKEKLTLNRAWVLLRNLKNAGNTQDCRKHDQSSFYSYLCC